MRETWESRQEKVRAAARERLRRRELQVAAQEMEREHPIRPGTQKPPEVQTPPPVLETPTWHRETVVATHVGPRPDWAGEPFVPRQNLPHACVLCGSWSCPGWRRCPAPLSSF